MAPSYILQLARQIFGLSSTPAPAPAPAPSPDSHPPTTPSHLSAISCTPSSLAPSSLAPPSLFSTRSACTSASSLSATCPPPDLKPPNTATFTPLALLGSGTHGSVFLVSSPTSQRYALKVVNKAHAKKRRVSGAQLLREQAAMHKTRDARGIVRMHASWHDKKHYFFLLEVYPNGDLYERVYAARLPSASVQFYAAQLLLALDHLHALHIVHHDLKLENIFLDAHGNVVLGDFGLCEFLDPVPHARCATHPSGRQSGTLPYFSPEIVKQMAVAYDVDRWAFGVVVYELLMSKLPFTDAREQDVVTRIIHAKPKFDASVHPEAKDFVLKILAKSRSARPSLAEMKMHAFFDGIDWTALEKGEVDPPTLTCKPAARTTAGLVLPKTKPYRRGRDPKPSFNYVSPSFAEAG